MKTITILLSLILLSCTTRDTSREQELQKEVISLQRQLDSIEVRNSTPHRYLMNTHYLTDDEIRDLRDSDPNHIYSTKGTGRMPVHSKQTEFENRMEQYMEDNYEELEEKYSD